MKKWRRVLAGVLACVLCLSLGGCQSLDEARANHGVLQPDGSILLGETVYKPLPACDQLSPEVDHRSDVSVTDSEVPVLLANMFGSSYSKSKDGLFLMWQYDGYNEKGGLNYCREDRYEEILSRIEGGFQPDGYCYEYELYNEDTYEFVGEYYRLTDDQCQAVQTVYTTAVPSPMLSAATLTYDYLVELYLCSEDLLMREYAELDLCVLEGSYYLVEYTDTTVLYPVPVTMTATFEAIMKKYVNNQKIMYGEYVEEDIAL